MARVVEAWPEKRVLPEPSYSYPWDNWTDGSIWLADVGVDFPNHTSAFKATLFNYAQRITKMRQRKIDERLAGKTVRRPIKAEALKVKVRIVSDTQLAFQFYNEHNPPAAVEEVISATPKRAGRGAVLSVDPQPVKRRRLNRI
jgi:hypothetical protein